VDRWARKLVVVGVVGLVIGSAAVASALPVPSTLHTKRTTTPIAGTITAVVLRGDVGDLAVAAGARSRVVTIQRWNVAAPTVHQRFAAGVLTITTSCPRLPALGDVPLNNCSVDVAVTAPAGASVRATAAVGDVSTAGLAGQQKLRADVGGVQSLRTRSRRAQLVSNVGDATATFLRAPSRAALTANVGDVDLAVPGGTYDLDASTTTGKVRVTGITNSPDASRTLVAKSTTGDIVVRGR
jgi:hypothetical protein